MRAILSDLSSLREDEITLDLADAYLWRIELTYRELLAMDAFGGGGGGGGGSLGGRGGGVWVRVWG